MNCKVIGCEESVSPIYPNLCDKHARDAEILLDDNGERLEETEVFDLSEYEEHLKFLAKERK